MLAQPIEEFSQAVQESISAVPNDMHQADTLPADVSPRSRNDEVKPENHKKVSQLEKSAHAEPLPPTPISAEAQKQLESWGVPLEFIQQIQELTSSFRSDLVVDHSAEIAQMKNAAEGLDRHYNREVILPSLSNYTDKGNGTGPDLTIQFLQAFVSDILPRLNKILMDNGKQPLGYCFVKGSPPTHFNEYFWASLVPLGQPMEAGIVIDPGFQKITTQESSGYQIQSQQDTTSNRIGTMRNPSDHWVTSQTNFSVGEYQRTETEVTFLKRPYQEVIGFSADKKLSYSMGFITKSEGDGRDNIQITVGITFADKNKPGVQCILEGDRIVWLNRTTDITPENEEEVRQIMVNLSKLSISRNDNAYQNARNTAPTHVHYRQ